MEIKDIVIGKVYVWLPPNVYKTNRHRYKFWPSSIDAEVIAITAQRVKIRFKVDGNVLTRFVQPTNLYDWLDEQGNMK